MKILIAEDDRQLNEGIRLCLRENGREFLQCYSAAETLRSLEAERPRLLILDVNFPDGSGLDILKEVRRQRLPVRIILLTANNMEMDVVTGLELGADDYITKPFGLMELRARVNVQLRSLSRREEAVFLEDEFCFDFDRMLFSVKGSMVELSRTEQKTLRILLENRGRTVTRETLIDRVWDGDAQYVDGHALTVTVKRLRDKLGAGEDGPIRTVYGVGYVWQGER